MAKVWFKARRYGWGWTPVSIAGWAVVALSVVLAVAGTAVFLYELRNGADPVLAAILFSLWIAFLAIATTAIGYAKGEPPGWRWGN